MELKTNKESLSVLKGISSFIEETTLIFSPDGLKVVEMDGANVCLAIVDLPKSKFSHYEVKEIEKVGLNLKDFLGFVDFFKEEFEMTTENNRVILKGGKYNFKLSQLELSDKEQKIPELTYDRTAKFEELKRDLKVLSKSSESTLFKIENSKLFLIAEGDLNRTEIVASATLDLTKEENVKVKFSNEYLIKIMNLGEPKEIKLKTDHPCEIVFENCRIILAPRCDNE